MVAITLALVLTSRLNARAANPAQSAIYSKSQLLVLKHGTVIRGQELRRVLPGLKIHSTKDSILAHGWLYALSCDLQGVAGEGTSLATITDTFINDSGVIRFKIHGHPLSGIIFRLVRFNQKVYMIHPGKADRFVIAVNLTRIEEC